MKMNKTTRDIVLATLSLLSLTACSIPLLTSKKVDSTLPQQYSQPANTQEDSLNVQVDWHQFFNDPKLMQLIDIALSNNKEVNILLQRINMAQNEIQARQGEYKPFVGFGAGVEGEKAGQYTRNGAVEENLEIKEGKSFPRVLGNYRFGLFSSWEVDVWKKLRNASQVAVYEYMASIEGRQFLVTNLVAEVAHSYYELVALDNQLENLEQNIAIQQQGLEIVRELQIYARTNSLAVKRYEAEVSKNKSRQYLIKQQIVEVENRINLLLGRTSLPIERSSSGFMQTKLKTLQTGIPSQLLQNRADIRQAEMELKAAELNIDVARANFYPSFSIRAGLGFEAFKSQYLLNTPESLAYSFGGDILAPLINRNAIIANFKNANAKQIQAAYEYEQTIIKAYAEVLNQMSKIEKLNDSFQLKTSQVEKLNQSVDVATQLFKAARADYLDVLLTQRETLDAKSEMIENKLQQMTAQIDLYRALGGGWQNQNK